MNKPIRAVAIFCLLLFVALMGNATYLQFFDAGSLNDRPENRRVQNAAYSSERGAILVGRTPVAESRPVDDQYEYLRTYPTPFLYAPVTGYFTFGAATGIESSQNDVLAGDDPRLFLRSVVDLVSNGPQRGGDVQLTIDPQAQRAAYEGLAGIGPDAEGAVVALEPATGRILAMVSIPTFDPNRLSTHDFGASADAYARLDGDESDPLVNRAVQTRLFPGSTFKMVTAAAALESGQYEGPDAQVPGGDTYTLPNSTAVVDNGGRICGGRTITLRQAMEQSCNTTFAQLADGLGSEAMLEQAERFGFNDTALSDLGGEVPSTYPATDDPAQLALTGFGQSDVQATPLQMAMVSAAIANDGVVMRPFLVDELQAADYEAEGTEPEELSEAISPRTAETLTEVLVSTVDNGTATPAAIDGIAVAGKTGTAERGEGLQPYAWFTSFAPADNPQVAVAVMIESAPGREIAGGALGGPVAKAVMEAVLR